MREIDWVGLRADLTLRKAKAIDDIPELVERFTRVSADTIAYQMTLDDPTTWTHSWTAEMPLKRNEQALYEYACHEGNFALVTGVLAGAHADKRGAR